VAPEAAPAHSPFSGRRPAEPALGPDVYKVPALENRTGPRQDSVAAALGMQPQLAHAARQFVDEAVLLLFLGRRGFAAAGAGPLLADGCFANETSPAFQAIKHVFAPGRKRENN